MLRAYTSQKFYHSSLIQASKIWFHWSYVFQNFWLIIYYQKFGRKTSKKVNYFRNPDLYCKQFSDGILSRAFSSFQKAWLDWAELFKICGSRAKLWAEPTRLDTPLWLVQTRTSSTRHTPKWWQFCPSNFNFRHPFFLSAQKGLLSLKSPQMQPEKCIDEPSKKE